MKTLRSLVPGLGLALALVACGSSGGGSQEPPSTPPASTAAPAIGGEPKVGATLVATAGSWSGTKPIATAFAWRRCDSVGHDCVDLQGAWAATYVPVEEDVGATLKVLVTATNPFGEATAESVAVGPVKPAGPRNTALPQLSGAAVEGGTITATTGAWTPEGTLSLAMAWERCLDASAPCVAIAGATGTSYAPAAADLGHLLRLRVLATDVNGTTAAASAFTAPVARPGCAAALLQAGPATPGAVGSVAVTAPWSAPGNVKAADGASASASLPPGARSDWLVATGLAPAVPAGAEVRGLDVEVIGRSQSGAGVKLAHAVIVADGDAFETPAPAETWGTATRSVHVGGSTELWGGAWTPAKLAAPDLSVRLVFRNDSDTATDVVRVDAVRLTVHYVTFGQVGPAHPSSLTQRVASSGDVAWDAVSGAGDEDGVPASATLGPLQTSQTLVATGFGLSLPAGKTPSGVIVEVEELADSGASWVVVEKELRLVLGGAAVGEERSDPHLQGWPREAELVPHGGASDLWGATFSAADVAGADFGVQLAAYNYSGGATVTVGVEQIRVRVLFDPVAGQVSAQPAAAESEQASSAWSDPAKAAVADGDYALAAGLSGDDLTDDLAASQLGLSVPDGAIIHGVTLVVRRGGMNGVGKLVDSHVQLLNGGARGGSSRSSTPWATGVADATYGGPEDLWGHGWTPAEVNAPGFGAALAVEYQGSGNDWARVDGFSVTVHYCAP